MHFFMHYDSGRVRDLFLSFLEGETSLETLIQAVGSKEELRSAVPERGASVLVPGGSG